MLKISGFGAQESCNPSACESLLYQVDLDSCLRNGPLLGGMGCSISNIQMVGMHRTLHQHAVRVLYAQSEATDKAKALCHYCAKLFSLNLLFLGFMLRTVAHAPKVPESMPSPHSYTMVNSW
jgi:hypothetical protein